MTAALFQNWFVNFNLETKKSKHHILMILDNASCHIAYPKSNISIEFLSPDCTGFLQPQNVSVINSFKVHYRKYHVHYIIEKISIDNFSPIILHHAIWMIKKSI